jgi:predicted metal-dependent phosphoesterase TrpH
MTKRKTTKIDMHVHTKGSDGWGSPEAIVKQAKRAKLDGICITDHHQTYTAESLEVGQALRDAGLLAFHGCEYSTAWGHLLVYGVNVAEFTWWGYYPDPKQVIRDVNAAGGLCIPAHPFSGYKRRWSSRMKELRQLKGVVGLETANGQCAVQRPKANKQAAQFACKRNLVTVGGSDAHNPEYVGLCYTQIDGVIYTESELLRAIRLGMAKAVTAQKLVKEQMTRTTYEVREPQSYDLMAINLDSSPENGHFSLDGHAPPPSWWRDDFGSTPH